MGSGDTQWAATTGTPAPSPRPLGDGHLWEPAPRRDVRAETEARRLLSLAPGAGFIISQEVGCVKPLPLDLVDTQGDME